MKKATAKKIKNSTLLALFFLLVFLTILISLVVKIIFLITHSTVDSHHQFILEIKQQANEEQIVAFNRATSSISVLQVKGVKTAQDIQSLQIPIDAQFILPDTMKQETLPSELFTMIFHCRYPSCKNINTVDAIKLYTFANNLRPSAIQTTDLSIPISPADLKTMIPSLFTDDTLYHEALSISVINASGEVGLGNEASQLLSTIGGNVLSVTSADPQETTTMQSTYGKDTYSIQRLQKVLRLQSQKMQKTGISDIIITIGKKHPQL